MSLTYQQLADSLRRKAYARTVDTLKLQYERKWGLKIATVLKRAGSDTASAYLRGGLPAATRQLGDSFRAPFSEIYKDLYEEVGNVFGKLALETFVGGNGKSLEKAPLGLGPDDGYGTGPWDLWNVRLSPEFLRWLDGVTATRIKNITATTASTITKLVREQALRDGVSNEKIADKIKDLWSFSYDRATRISQTEINSAQNAASHYAMAKFVDTKSMVKSWLATNDKRTRPSHMRASASQKDIPFDEPFTVGGAKLMHPGDPSLGAPGREIIRCRCTTTFARNPNARPGTTTPPARPFSPPAVQPPAPPRPAPPPRPVTPRPVTPKPIAPKPVAVPKPVGPKKPLNLRIANGPNAQVDQELAAVLRKAFDNASDLLIDAINVLPEVGRVVHDPFDETAYYSPLRLAIHADKRTAPDRLLKTMAHEYGHHIDYVSSKKSMVSTPREKGGLLTAIEEARNTLSAVRARSAASWSSLKEEGMAYLNSTYQDRTIADLLGTLSKGEVGGGHSIEYYNRPNNNADSEIVAHLVTYYSNPSMYQRQLDFVKRMFPSMIEDFEASLKYVAKHQRVRTDMFY